MCCLQVASHDGGARQSRTIAMSAPALRSVATPIIKSKVSGSADQEARRPSKPSSAILLVIIPRNTNGIDKQKVVHHVRNFESCHPPMSLLQAIPSAKATAGRTKAAAKPKIRLWRCSLITSEVHALIETVQERQDVGANLSA